MTSSSVHETKPPHERDAVDTANLEKIVRRTTRSAVDGSEPSGATRLLGCADVLS